MVESTAEHSVGQMVVRQVGMWDVPMAEMMVGYLEPLSAVNSAYKMAADSANLSAESTAEHSVGQMVDRQAGRWDVPRAEMMVGYLEPLSAVN